MYAECLLVRPVLVLFVPIIAKSPLIATLEPNLSNASKSLGDNLTFSSNVYSTSSSNISDMSILSM